MTHKSGSAIDVRFTSNATKLPRSSEMTQWPGSEPVRRLVRTLHHARALTLANKRAGQKNCR